MKELTRILHDLDQGNINAEEAEELIIKLINLKCKETAKNTRHEAQDILNGHIHRMEAPTQITDDIDRDIANIKFDDVKPTI